jgi:hypothetical protein
MGEIMKWEKFKKEEIKLVIIILLLGVFILNIFIEGGTNISILIFFAYIGHKYLGNIKDLDQYKNYEFIDEEKYKKGLKNFAIFVDIYVIIRIASIILTKYNAYVMAETLLVLLIMVPYESYLSKKYVKCIHNKDENTKNVFVKYKVITLVMCIAFIAFTVIFLTWVNKGKEEGLVKFFNYEYSLTSENNKREVMIKSGSMKAKAIEDEQNEKYFDTYSNKASKCIDLKALKVYSYFGIGFMLLMILLQNTKYKSDYEVTSTMSNVFLVGFIIFSMIGFNDIHHNIENDLITYLHTYIS